jgi:hypothetical protein
LFRIKWVATLAADATMAASLWKRCHT